MAGGVWGGAACNSPEREPREEEERGGGCVSSRVRARETELRTGTSGMPSTSSSGRSSGPSAERPPPVPCFFAATGPPALGAHSIPRQQIYICVCVNIYVFIYNIFYI